MLFTFTAYDIHVHVFHRVIPILWWMLCDGFTYFTQDVRVTATLPHSAPHYLPTIDAGSDEWHYIGDKLYHNRSSAKLPNLPSLNDLSIQQRIGLQISTNGQLHMTAGPGEMGRLGQLGPPHILSRATVRAAHKR